MVFLLELLVIVVLIGLFVALLIVVAYLTFDDWLVKFGVVWWWFFECV